MHHYINHHILLAAKLGDIVGYDSDYDLMTHSLGVLYDEIFSQRPRLMPMDPIDFPSRDQ